MEAYLDNAATTKPLPSVIEKMLEVYESYGNPSSLHKKGIKAENYIKEAKDIFAELLKVDAKEIYFTSGGTESNNMAIIGTAFANMRLGRHIITSSIEHASVLSTYKYLEEEGFEISILPVNEVGLIEERHLKEAIKEETILVSLMHVNNEIGTVQMLKALKDCIKEQNSRTLFHVDAMQSFGKYELHPKRIGIDLLSISAHKIHGPKGNGLLYVRDKVKIKPIIYGGGHQKGLRSGTENVAGIAGFACAAKEAYRDLEDKVSKLYCLKKRLATGLCEVLEDVTINGDELDNSAPHILNLRFKDVRSEVLLHALEEKDIYISTGSACSTHKSVKSQTLKAIGLTGQGLDESVRFSFSVNTTENEIDYTIDVLKDVVPFLRRYTRGGR